MEDRYRVIPIADTWFLPVNPVSNPVKWYIKDTKDLSLHGPYVNKAHAEKYASMWNEHGSK